MDSQTLASSDNQFQLHDLCRYRDSTNLPTGAAVWRLCRFFELIRHRHKSSETAP